MTGPLTSSRVISAILALLDSTDSTVKNNITIKFAGNGTTSIIRMVESLDL